MKDRIYDAAVIGCGPAGLSAAINMKIRNSDILVFGTEICSPRLHRAEKVNNYPGFYDKTGEEIMKAFIEHVRGMKIEIKKEKVDMIYDQGDKFTLSAIDNTYQARTVILAPGVSSKNYLEGEEDLVGSGISYCATCDGALYKGKDIAVIAYDKEEGIEETEYLAEIVDKVYFIPVYDYQDELDGIIKNKGNIEIIHGEVQAVKGEYKVEELLLDNKSLVLDGIFIFRQVIPPDKLIYGLELEGPHIKVDNDMHTSIEGVFAAGDCTGTPYQLSRAAGQGQVAGLNAASYARKKRKE